MRRVVETSDALNFPSDSALRVLYVDDELDNQRVLQLHLGSRCDILLASSDEEACGVLSAVGGEIDIILMDIELKGSRLDGIDLVRLIRGKLSRDDLPFYALNTPRLSTPVVFITAYGARLVAAAMESKETDWVLGKPVDFSRLDEVLTNVGMRRSSHSGIVKKPQR